MSQTISSLCVQQMFATFHAVNDDLLDFVRELGGADHLPSKFTINVPEMNAIEIAIETAVERNDLQETEDLCTQYRERFTAYLAAWRQKVAKRKEAAA